MHRRLGGLEAGHLVVLDPEVAQKPHEDPQLQAARNLTKLND